MTDATTRSELLRLGALEQQVMNVLWDEGPPTVRDVITHIGGKHAYTTIATVLGNLERKELVAPKKEGRSVRYAARHTRDVHAARLMGQALSTSHDRVASILHFIDSIDPHDAELLRAYLEEQRGDG